MSGSFWQEMKEKKHVWLLFFPLMLFYAASYFQRTVIPGTTFNEFQVTYGLSAAEIAGLSAAYVYIYAFCQLIAGMLADKYGGTRIVTVTGAVFCVGVIGFPFCNGNLTLMYVFRFLAGLGSSGLYLSLVKEADRLFGRKNYSVMLGIVYFVGYSGGLFGTYPFAWLSGYFFWNNMLIAAGFVSLGLYLWFLGARRVVPAAPVRKEPLSLRPLWQVVKNPLSWLINFCSTVNFSCYAIIQMVFGKKFLQDVTGWSDTGASAVVFGQTLVCMFALLSGGIQSRITGNRRKPLMIFASGLVLANTVMMLLAVTCGLPAWIYAVGVLLYAAGSGFSIVNTLAVQEVNARDCLTLASGFNNSVNYLTIAIFSPLIGALLDTFAGDAVRSSAGHIVYPMEAYQTVFALLLIPTVCGVLVSIFFIPETKGHFLHQRISL